MNTIRWNLVHLRKNDLDIWPMTVKFNGVRAKYHQAECSSSWVIVLTEKKNSDENNKVRRYCADSKNDFRQSCLRPAWQPRIIKPKQQRHKVTICMKILTGSRIPALDFPSESPSFQPILASSLWPTFSSGMALCKHNRIITINDRTQYPPLY